MNINQMWDEFIRKLKFNNLSEDDFTGINKNFLINFLIGDNRRQRREKIINANVKFDIGETKNIVTVFCDDCQYRFDFKYIDNKWKLCFIECITIPIKIIEKIPFDNFPIMDEQEIWIRAEKSISRNIYLYNKFKDKFGKKEALKLFSDGAGEFLAAKSWIPFFDERKAFVVYMAWTEKRINGEYASIELFDTNKCIIKLRNHLWFRVYKNASHLKSIISENEYRELFEYIWNDRGKQSGWKVNFEYDGSDTSIIFSV